MLLINTGSPLQRFEYIAAEPDFIDRADGSLYSPKAHFIAFPYIKDGVMASPISVPNLLTGLRDTSNQLNHANVNNTDAANALSHFVHYVGDAHQPLHCIRLYSTRFPRGDYGGNAYAIRYSSRINSLHKLWDAGVKGFKLPHHRGRLSMSDRAKLVQKITARYPVSYFGNLVEDQNPTDWVTESYQTAKNIAYTVPEGKRPSAHYLRISSDIVWQRVALAGYRLAYFLNYSFTKK